jgi:hypothetical protein
MPTRFVDPSLIRRAFDMLVPPGASSKQYLRWRRLASLVGLGEHWIRKRYQGRDRSELEVESIGRIRRALEAKHHDSPDPEARVLIELLSTADTRTAADRFGPPRRHSVNESLRLRVVNVGFVLSSNANYCQRLEAGIRFGMLNGLRMTHLIDDESLDLSRATTEAGRQAAIRELLGRFNDDPRYVDRTYIVLIGTVAATAAARFLESDREFRCRLGRDMRVIFAGVTDPEITGLLSFSRDYVGGMYAGVTFADRLQFIADTFPDRKIALLYDPSLPQEIVVRDQVRQWRNGTVEQVNINKHHPTRLPRAIEDCLVTGYTVINMRIHELVRDHPTIPFIGVNTSDLGRGAVLSTGNNDLLFGIDCAERLLVPDCHNEINLRDMEIIRPEPIYGINQKACNLHGLVATIAARKKCKVVVD